MKYLCLACGDAAAWEQLGEDEQQSMVEACRVHDGWYVVVRPMFTPELEALGAREATVS